MTDIGSAVPKGVVDVSRDFVGIPPQETNVHREITRLKRQVRQMRGRAQNMGMPPAKADRRRYSLAGVAIAAGLAGFAFALWRTRMSRTFWR